MGEGKERICLLGAHHMPHVVAMARQAQMRPNLPYEIDFLRLDPSIDAVGYFGSDSDPAQEAPLGVANLLFDGRKTFLGLLIVDEQQRRRGIGARLVRWAIEASMQAETRPATIGLVASQQGAPLYKGLGFHTIGHSSLYELPAGDHGSSGERQEKARQVLFARIEQLGTMHNGKQLWAQAVGMLSDSTCSIPRTTRLSALVQPHYAHLLYDASDDADPRLLAWCAVRPYSAQDWVIGLLMAPRLEEALEVIKAVPSQQLAAEHLCGRGTVEQPSGSFFLHLDSRSGQDGELARALEDMGWRQLQTLEILEKDLGNGGEESRRSEGARQFAMADWTHG